MSKLSENELKLTKTTSALSARDKNFFELQSGEKARKQTYYNRGFKDAENSTGPVIFQAWKFRFMEGWMTVVNTISLLEDSPFRNSEQVLLPEDATSEVQAEEQVENSSDEEEGAVSLESRELS